MATQAPPLECSTHQAAQYLNLPIIDEMRRIINRRYEPLQPELPPNLQFLLCNWGGMNCNKKIDIYSAVWTLDLHLIRTMFKCTNCRGLKAHQEWELSKGMNVTQGHDSFIRFDGSWLDSPASATYTWPYAHILKPPEKEALWKSIEVQEGNVRYSKLVEITDPMQKFLYYARGFIPEMK